MCAFREYFVILFDFRDYEYEDYELIDLRDTVEYSHDGGKFY